MVEKTPTEVYERIIADLATDEVNALISSLPPECHETIDRLLYERPITNPDDNWVLRMAKIRHLDRTAAIELISSWKNELDGPAVH